MIKIVRTVKPKSPVVIAAWPGMGHVAFKAANYLKDKLRARLFARLSPQGFFYQSDISIKRSVIDIQRLPSGEFYHWENKTGAHDVVIFIGEQQPPSEKAGAYAAAIVDFSQQKLNAAMIVTFAALVSSIDFIKIPTAWLAVTHREVLKNFAHANIKPLEHGQVSGLNGLLLGLAKKRKMKGACILGEIPFYAAQIENPRSSMVVLDALARYLAVHIDLTELSVAAKVLEDEIEKLIEHVKRPGQRDEGPQPISTEDIERIKSILESRSHIPNSVKEQIEALFVHAQKDSSRAMELKKMLDEWNVYKDYEDRFLKLFAKDGEEGDGPAYG